MLQVKTGPESYVHIRIFKPLPHTEQPTVAVAIQLGKSFGDPITYFSAEPTN